MNLGEAIAAVKQLGGWGDLDPNPLDPSSDGPRSINLRGRHVTDDHLAALASFPDLECLFLQATSVSGLGLARLRQPDRLRRLSLDTCPVTDAGLEVVGGLRGLLSLNLLCTPTADAGLAHFRGLTALRELELGNTRVTDAGLAFLGGLAD